MFSVLLLDGSGVVDVELCHGRVRLQSLGAAQATRDTIDDVARFDEPRGPGLRAAHAAEAFTLEPTDTRLTGIRCCDRHASVQPSRMPKERTCRHVQECVAASTARARNRRIPRARRGKSPVTASPGHAGGGAARDSPRPPDLGRVQLRNREIRRIDVPMENPSITGMSSVAITMPTVASGPRSGGASRTAALPQQDPRQHELDHAARAERAPRCLRNLEWVYVETCRYYR